MTTRRLPLFSVASSCLTGCLIFAAIHLPGWRCVACVVGAAALFVAGAATTYRAWVAAAESPPDRR